MQFDVYQSSDLSAAWPDAPPAQVPAAPAGSVTAYGFLPPQDAAAGNYNAVLFVSLFSGPTRTFSGLTVLRVRSSVAAACTIAAGTLSFGSYDPLGVNAVSPLDAQGTFQVACTRNTGYTVGLGPGGFAAGTVRQMASGAQRLQYELYADPGRTSPWTATATVGGTAPSTAPVTLTVYGRVPAGQPAPAGAYADTVQSTINF
ncbi:MAG TPA: spore coat U domain-containing protein [Anaeromyxobacteraceae bacterium]|nr:spore coat U domain-containing protein [Anaeromyxobacteraceae bacterium]